jgi:hypothetical protein
MSPDSFQTIGPAPSGRAAPTRLRMAIIALAGIETFVLGFYAGFFASQIASGDPLGREIAKGVALLACGPLLLFSLPALILGLLGRALVLALVLALLAVPLAWLLYVFA